MQNFNAISPNLLITLSFPLCTVNPDDPPPPPPGSVMESPDPPFWSGDYVTYTCEDGLMSPFGTTYYIIISTRDGWTILDPEFGCFNGD